MPRHQASERPICASLWPTSSARIDSTSGFSGWWVGMGRIHSGMVAIGTNALER
jgi:hypothetical protein